MIRKFVHDDSRNWDKWLVPLLFAVREASMGFSPFELLFGRKPWGVSVRYGPASKTPHTGQMSRENLLEAQERQQRLYNRGMKLGRFSPGDKVLVLLPTSSTK